LHMKVLSSLFMVSSVLLALIATPLTASAAGNLLSNGGVESVDSNIPMQWSTLAYDNGSGVTKFSISNSGAHSGTNAITIENMQANDARWIQKIQVRANTLYKLSGWVKAENIGANGKGANITAEGIMSSSPEVKDTQGQWQLLELYGKTGEKQTELTFDARIGGYGLANTGKASFDDMAVEAIKAVPSGAVAVSLDPNAVGPAATPTVQTAPKASHSRLIIWSLLFVILFLLVYNYMIRRQQLIFNTRESTIAIAALLAIAAFVRLLIAPSMVGFSADIGSFVAWSQDVATNGLTHFYAAGKLADYPPGYMYVLFILGKLSHALGWHYPSQAMILLYKIPSMLADLICTYLIFRIGRKYLSPTIALAVAALYAFNPAILLNSAAWGQIDSFFMLFILVAIMLLMHKKVPLATAVFAVALLIKPQALMFGPLLLFVFIQLRRDFKTIILSVLSGLLTLIVVPLPFTIYQPNGPLYLVHLYTSTLGSYNFVSLNAYNLLALTGGNWQPLTKKILFLSYNSWSYILVVASLVYCGYLYFKSKADSSKLYWIAFIFLTAAFMITVKMHERYLFYALLPALMTFIYFRDRRILYLFFGFSLTHFFNADEILANNLANINTFNTHGFLLMITSFMNTLLFIYLIKVSYDVLIRDRVDHLNGSERNGGSQAKSGTDHVAPLLMPDDLASANLVRKDYWIIGILTITYAAIAFIHLGSLKEPVTFWQPANAGESFYVDLGTTQPIVKVNSFAGPGDGTFQVEFSNDALKWKDPQLITRNYGNVFAWNSLNVNENARYMKVITEQPGFRLNEIALYGEGNDKPLHYEIVVPGVKSNLTVGRPANVFDEQNKAAYVPTFMNGTYFDEIYHARTAYEQLHRIPAFETTHPPLGKIIIGWGTLIFGMNPFGWRIMGTLLGIGMVPLFYIFGKMLFRKTEYAFYSAFLLTFDFLHFVQTRIATIDVYGVFFIILMYFFMYRYYRMSFNHVPLRKTLVPLGLSGLFFGLGAASKWTGIFAGAGLAVLFFLTLYERYREYKQAKLLIVTRHQVKKSDEAQKLYRNLTALFPANMLQTILWCGLFFIVVPCIIYLLSYIPFMLVPGPGHGLMGVIKSQKDMYEYQAHLVATHPFSSVWWQWPIMEKPMWYYSGPVSFDKMSSIVAMGNPAVWWVGTIAVFSTLWVGLFKKDKVVLFLFLALCSNYLPWIPIHRLTFIYHFFGTVPFLILCIVYMIKHFKEKLQKLQHIKLYNYLYNYVVYVYLAVVLGLFVMFYPILSGMTVDKSYGAHFLRWFSSWIFYS